MRIARAFELPTRLLLTCSMLLVVGLSFALATLLPGGVELGSPQLISARGFRPQSSLHCHARKPNRVASTALVADELLLELVPERLVSVSYIVDWPSVTPIAGRVPARLPRVNGSAEQLLAVRPDLVVASDYNYSALLAQLESAELCVFTVRGARTFGELEREIERLGDALGASERARAMNRELERRLSALSPRDSQSAAPRALLLHEELAYAKGSLQHDCLARAGLADALAPFELEGTPKLGVEYLLLANPDYVFVAADVRAPVLATRAMRSLAYPWELTRAYREKHVYAVPQVWMASVTQYAVLACEAYATLTRAARAT